jgi:hypothetical protein
MNTAATLLQVALAILTSAQHNTQASLAAREQLVIAAAQSEQLAVQAMAPLDFPITPNDSKWPTTTDVYNAPYRDQNGNYGHMGQVGTLVAEDTSFGDLNGDGLDDAAVVIQSVSSDGSAHFELAALLNQGGILFNIANLQLGNNTVVYSHQIADGGEIVLDMQSASQPRATYHYELLGDAIVPVSQ